MFITVKLPDFSILSLGLNEVSGRHVQPKAIRRCTFILPARLHNAWNFSLKGERAEAETADAELAQERARTTAELAAVVLARLELRLLCIFDAFCGRCHIFALYPYCKLCSGPSGPAWLSSDAEGHSEALQQSACSVVILRRRDDGDVHSLEFVDLRVVNFGEDELVTQTERVVAAAIKALRGDATEVAHTRQSDRNQTVQELVHRVATQRNHRADGHALAHLEGSDGLLGLGRHRLLTRDSGKISNQRIHDLNVLGGFAKTHVDHDLLDLGNRHGVGDVQFLA